MKLLQQVNEKISTYLNITEENINVFQNNLLEGTVNEYSTNITNRVLRCLEDVNGISLPNYSDINDKVVESLKKEANKYIGEINSYLVNQRNIVDSTTSKNEQLHLPEFEEELFKEYIIELGNKLSIENDINEEIPNEIISKLITNILFRNKKSNKGILNEIISKLITNILFRNKQTDINQYSDKIEIEIRTIVNEEYKKFNDECYMSSMTVKKDLININNDFFNEIEEEKKKIKEFNSNEIMSIIGKLDDKEKVEKIPNPFLAKTNLPLKEVESKSLIKSIKGIKPIPLKTDIDLGLPNSIFNPGNENNNDEKGKKR